MDLATVQGWESGRRPLANIRAGALVDLRRRLPVLGADPAVVGLLDAAMDADRIIGASLEPPAADALYPLAGWVHTRDTAHMIAWAVNGTPPPALAARPAPRRHGAVATAPLLSAQDRAVFFTDLRNAVASTASSPLLRRQALYLASYDPAPDASAWMAHTLHGDRSALPIRGWSPYWAQARSTATALARRGDTLPLLDFIDRSIADNDEGEAANLNYWAYWMGAVARPQADDSFMRDRDLTGWDAVTLLRLLSQGLQEAPGYTDLYAHSLWALLTARPWLPQAAPALADVLAERSALILDSGRLSPRSRRELSTVHDVLRQGN